MSPYILETFIQKYRLFSHNSCKINIMKAALKYLAGIAGPSGYGSNSTANEVTQHCFCPPRLLTAIITGNYLILPLILC